MMDQQTFFTEQGFEDATKELHYLKTVRRKEVAKRIEKAKELGDLSENAEYAAAREEQGFLEGRIAELENSINNAEVIQKDASADYIRPGSSVLVKMNGDQKEFTIVGSEEANPMEGRISNESPLGQAFLGKRSGETVSVTVPKGELTYTILSIS